MSRRICSSNDYATGSLQRAVIAQRHVAASRLRQQDLEFRQPTLRYRHGAASNTGCGPGSVGMGPFYCPADQTIYIDVSFYDQLGQQLGAGGDFARLYVMAHEYAPPHADHHRHF